MERFDKYPTLLEAQNAAGFSLKVPQPRVDGFFQALVYRHVPNALLCWHPDAGKTLFINEAPEMRWPIPKSEHRLMVRDGREIFVLGPGDPRGGQAVACWSDDIAVRLSGSYSPHELILFALNLQPLRV
jgi:hypothetical protein